MWIVAIFLTGMITVLRITVRAIISQAIYDLKAKGIPASVAGKKRRIIYALFIPQILRGHTHQQNAQDLVSCLR